MVTGLKELARARRFSIEPNKSVADQSLKARARIFVELTREKAIEPKAGGFFRDKELGSYRCWWRRWPHCSAPSRCYNRIEWPLRGLHRYRKRVRRAVPLSTRPTRSHLRALRARTAVKKSGSSVRFITLFCSRRSASVVWARSTRRATPCLIVWLR